ncbi:hypothetical protein [Planctomyces sp. SH-PL14]|uniref:hypothetical protein n=1 Tax=Planctomyces sp. SH-PL14 TaxID=1632864 RepID=UPI0009465C1E|nr:hypothetical protein [Planctomyces sp. SH-PL14]
MFERFTTDDGAGVFWSIVHGLESIPRYEGDVIKLVRRASSEFPVLMLGRMLNSGVQEVGSIRLTPLLQEVIQRHDATPEARRAAQIFVEKHGT